MASFEQSAAIADSDHRCAIAARPDPGFVARPLPVHPACAASAKPAALDCMLLLKARGLIGGNGKSQPVDDRARLLVTVSDLPDRANTACPADTEGPAGRAGAALEKHEASATHRTLRLKVVLIIGASIAIWPNRVPLTCSKYIFKLLKIR